MLTKHPVRRTFLAAGVLGAVLALPRSSSADDKAADDDRAARAAAASDPQYTAGYLNSWTAMRKMKPMEVMHIVDADKKGYVTKEEFMKFQEQFFRRMDRDHDGKISAQEWMGTGAGGAPSPAKK